MRQNLFIAAMTLLTAVSLGVTVAVAQSADIIFLDEIQPEPEPDAGSADVAVGATDSSSHVDAHVGVLIEGISDSLPEPARPLTPENPRPVIADAVTNHVRGCIARHGADQLNVDIGFLYLVREERQSATLSSINNDDGMHVSRRHIDILRSVGETRAVDVESRRRVFLECVQVVGLPVKPVVSERLSFRIVRAAPGLKVRDLAWQAL